MLRGDGGGQRQAALIGADGASRAHARAAVVITLTGVVFVLVAVVSPTLDVGFTADDYYIVRRIHDQSVATPSFGDQARAAFSRQWSEGYDAFRPLTIGGMQLDYALWGADGRAFHRTNLILWLAVALAFGEAVRALLHGDALLAIIAAALFALWPLGFEPLGWTVIRQDSWLMLSAALACRAVLARGRSPVWVAAALIPAFCAKDSAPILAPMVSAFDVLVAVPRERAAGTPGRRRRFVGRQLGIAAIVGAWLLARFAVFERFGSSWQGRSYGSHWTEPGVLSECAARLAVYARRMIAPINDAAWSRAFPRISPAFAAAAWIALGVAVAATGRRAFTGIRMRGLCAVSAWVLPACLFFAPLYAVGSDLEVSRILVLPGCVVPAFLAASARRIVIERPLGGVIAVIACLAAGAFVTRNALGAYVRGSAAGERLAAEIGEDDAAGAVVVVGARPPTRPEAVVDALMVSDGAHVLSAGVFDALMPPFRGTPIRLTLLDGRSDADADVLAKATAERPQPAIRVVVRDDAGPRVLPLFWAAGSDRIEIEPRAGAPIRFSSPPTFHARLPRGMAAAEDVCRFRIGIPPTLFFQADVAASESADGFAASLRPQDFPPLALTMPPVSGALFWQVELLRNGARAAVSRYASAPIAP